MAAAGLSCYFRDVTVGLMSEKVKAFCRSAEWADYS